MKPLLAVLRLLRNAAVLVPALLCLGMMCLMRPFRLVRVGPLHSERFGHLVEEPEIYLAGRELGRHPPGCIDIFFHGGRPANPVAEAMARRHLTIHPLARYIHALAQKLPGCGRHIVRVDEVYDPIPAGPYIWAPFLRPTPHVGFLPEEDERAAALLSQAGFDSRRPYVCCVARDSSYLRQALAAENFSRHDYRNCDIETYLPALRFLTGRGDTVFRMGSVVERPLITDDPMIVDYASRFRDPLLDIWLPAHCRFMISSGTGVDAAAYVFRRPVLFVNMPPASGLLNNGPADLLVPKLFAELEGDRLLSFREVVDRGLDMACHTEDFSAAGTRWVDNSPEEILEAVVEMTQRLDGTWRPEPDDEELQARFWAIMRPNDHLRRLPSRIAAVFLRRHRALLN